MHAVVGGLQGYRMNRGLSEMSDNAAQLNHGNKSKMNFQQFPAHPPSLCLVSHLHLLGKYR